MHPAVTCFISTSPVHAGGWRHARHARMVNFQGLQICPSTAPASFLSANVLFAAFNTAMPRFSIRLSVSAERVFLVSTIQPPLTLTPPEEYNYIVMDVSDMSRTQTSSRCTRVSD